MHYDPRVEAEWGYGSLMGERDLMLHGMANYPLHWMPESFRMEGKEPYLSAEQAVKLTAEAMIHTGVMCSCLTTVTAPLASIQSTR
jgi:aldehyde:ferredoxin oxidoreductase